MVGHILYGADRVLAARLLFVNDRLARVLRPAHRVNVRIHAVANGIVPVLVRSAEEGGAERDHHDATGVGDPFDEFVTHVALPAGRKMAAGRVGGDNRRVGLLDGIQGRRVGDVGDIYHDAEPIHFRNHLLPERTQAIPPRLGVVVGGIPESVVCAVREGDVPDAAVVEMLHVVELAAEAGAVFHSQGEGHGLRRGNLPHLVRRGRQCKLGRVIRRDRLHQVDERVGPVHCGGGVALQIRGNVDGHEGRVEAAGPGPRVIDIAPHRGVGRVFVEVIQAVGQVDVAVHEEGGLDEAVGPGLDRRGGLCLRDPVPHQKKHEGANDRRRGRGRHNEDRAVERDPPKRGRGKAEAGGHLRGAGVGRRSRRVFRYDGVSRSRGPYHENGWPSTISTDVSGRASRRSAVKASFSWNGKGSLEQRTTSRSCSARSAIVTSGYRV